MDSVLPGCREFQCDSAYGLPVDRSDMRSNRYLFPVQGVLCGDVGRDAVFRLRGRGAKRTRDIIPRYQVPRMII